MYIIVLLKFLSEVFIIFFFFKVLICFFSLIFIFLYNFLEVVINIDEVNLLCFVCDIKFVVINVGLDFLFVIIKILLGLVIIFIFI